MAQIVNIDIRLDQIPSQLVSEFRTREGSKGASVKLAVVQMRAADQYGNTHTVYIRQTQEQRARNEPRVYVGKGYIREIHTASTGQSNSASSDDLPY